MSSGGAAGLRKSGPGASGFESNLCSFMGITAPPGMRHQLLASLVYMCVGLWVCIHVCAYVCVFMCVHVWGGGHLHP